MLAILAPPTLLSHDPLSDLTSPPAVIRAAPPASANYLQAPMGDLYSLSFTNRQSASGWDLKFKMEELTKPDPDGKIDFDARVVSIIKQLADLHPYFKSGLEALGRHGYQFKIYDPADPALGDVVKAEMNNGASACTSIVNKRIYLVMKTDESASAASLKSEFVATLAYELVHVIKNRTYSRYDDEIDAFKNIKQIVEDEKAGKKNLGNAEELLFQVAQQELLGKCVSENISALCQDRHAQVDRTYFSSPAFNSRLANYVMHVFNNMWGAAAIDAIKYSKSPHPEILTDEELKIFVARLSRNISESASGDQIASELKAWGFSFAAK